MYAFVHHINNKKTLAATGNDLDLISINRAISSPQKGQTYHPYHPLCLQKMAFSAGSGLWLFSAKIDEESPKCTKGSWIFEWISVSFVFHSDYGFMRHLLSSILATEVYNFFSES